MVDQVNQLAAGGMYIHEDCGEACVDSIKIDAGKPDTVRSEEQFDAAHNDDPYDGTGGDVHVLSLAAAGIPAHTASGDTLALINDGISKGHNRWMIAIWSNSYGDPQPNSGIGHWILCYAHDAAGFHCMNPLGGRLVTYTDQQIESAQQHYIVAVEIPISVSPVPIAIVVEAPTLNRQEIAGTLKLAYAAIGQPWADVTDSPGFNHQVDAVVNRVVDIHTAINNIIASHIPVPSQ